MAAAIARQPTALCLLLLSVVLGLPCSVASSKASSASNAREPLVVSVSGGGYVSMTSGMALVRALVDGYGKDKLRDITHLGGNSGGAFFGTQFMFSTQFVENLTDTTVDLEAMITVWLDRHVSLMRGLFDKNDPLYEEFGPATKLLAGEHGCWVNNRVNRMIFDAFEDRAKYALRYLPLVAASVVKNTVGGDASTATYASKNFTFRGITLVQATTLPPDAYTSEQNIKTGRTDINSLHAIMADGSGLDFAAKGYALPAAFVATSGKKQEWLYNPDIAALNIVSKGSNTTSPLPLPEDPLLAEVTAASGCATGFAGSPTIYRTIAKKFVKVVTDNPLLWFLRPLLDNVESCWPYGAQILGVPMTPPHLSVADAERHAPFRYLDGGYAENTALPLTLAKTQQDCKAGLLDCRKPIKAILINDGNHTSPHNGFGDMIAMDPLRALFTSPDRHPGTWVDGMLTTVKVPSPTIFEDSFPGENDWKPYNTVPHIQTIGAKKMPFNVTSYYYSGVLTTVENKFYGVVGGQKVHLLVFSLDIPGYFWPGLGDPEQTKFLTPGHLRLADGAVMESPNLIAGHAPMAKSQAVAILPVLKSFFGNDDKRREIIV